MRNLAYYKGAKIQLRQAFRSANVPEYKYELAKAVRFVARRIELIERRVLHNSLVE